MGLSTEERISGAYHAIDKITSYSREIDEKWGSYTLLKEACKGLWHDLLGSDSNSCHWIVGSSASHKVTWESSTPWGVVIKESLRDAKSPAFPWWESDHSFDAKESCNVGFFLKSTDRNLGRAYEIFAWTEQLSYYVRRYSDDFLKKFESLDKKISEIMGLCYEIFSENKETCTRAYLLTQILDQMLQYPYRDKDAREGVQMDLIAKIFDKFNLQHSFLEPMDAWSETKLQDLMEIYIKLRTMEHEKKIQTHAGLEYRLYSLLRICGRKFHGEWEHKELRALLKKEKVKYTPKKLEEILAKNIKLYKEKEKGDSNRYGENKFESEKILYE